MNKETKATLFGFVKHLDSAFWEGNWIDGRIGMSGSIKFLLNIKDRHFLNEKGFKKGDKVKITIDKCCSMDEDCKH